jgi:hypothetical protein
MMEQQKKLDYALAELDRNLIEWGIDNYLGYRTPEVLRLSVSGATNLVELVNTLNAEIVRLNAIVGELSLELEKARGE